MRSVVYTAQAEVRGGRSDGRGSTADGALDIVLRAPRALGGEGGGTNPEQLFAVGFAACFESALALAARRQRLEAGEAAVAARVMLLRDGREYGLAVELAVSLPGVPDRERAAELVRLAHAACPYSKATRGNIPGRLSVNGTGVAA